MQKITHELPARRWTEYERGWGQRPDGFTVHRDEAEAERCVADYWKDEQERNKSGRVPDEYSRPEDASTIIPVSEALYEAVQEKGTVWGHYSSTNFTHALDWTSQ